MASLMGLNGGRVQVFSGREEADAYKAKDFIRMNASTIAKVGFFSHVISSTLKGRLKTDGHGFLNFVDRMLESRKSRVVAAVGTFTGLVTCVIQLVVWVASRLR